MKKYVLFFSAALILLGCDNRQNDAILQKSSSGKTLEVLVAADKGGLSAETCELIDSVFLQPQGCLPQPEPRFSVVSVPVSSLRNTHMFQMHRNIVILEVKDGNPDKVYIDRDKWAAPQVVADVAASSEASLRDLLRKFEPNIVNAIYNAEHQRMAKAFNNSRNVPLMNRVKEKFGFLLTFSEEFMWAKEDGDFAWIRKETKDISLDVLVSVTPYRSQDQLLPEKIHNRFDTVMRREVPGPSGVSYMATDRRVEMETRQVDFQGSSYCIETRGIWHLRGTDERMAGPFVAYSMLSPDKKFIVELIGFVYAPRFDKRDYLMQVEGICNSLRWTTREEK
ncbi:MAG: DUF4837 family protein [Bacteroidales bacterium]|nr:DUF4837 family protein [Bacteroidales bacterium]